ncbi:MAG: tetratricopeptide repeat protein, partial [Polyangiales bacterium]
MAKDEPEIPTGEYALVPEAFDFDDDSISSLLDTFVSTHTGPQVKHVSHPADPLDAGAQAAQRTVFQHAPREEALPLVGQDAAAKKRRVELLRALAERSAGSARSCLLTGAAELLEQIGAFGDAIEAYREAVASNPRDVVALRAVRRHAMRREDWEDAANCLRQEASLEISDDDRASALTLLAHVHLQRTGDRAAAEQAAREAASLCPKDFVAQLLVATGCLARGDLVGAGAAIADAAPTWNDATGQAVLLQHAGALMEQGGHLADARGLYQQASALDPSSLPARFGLIRAARALGDYADAVRSLRKTSIDGVHRRVGGALDRAAAADMASHLGDPLGAIALLREGDDPASTWTRTEIAAVEGDLAEAIDALEALEAAGTDVGRPIRLARRIRFLSEQRNATEATEDFFADDPYGLERYVRAAQRLRGEEDGSELRLVLDAMHAAPETIPADMVTADKAALLGDTAASLAALRREFERAKEPLGPTLAMAELAAELEDGGREVALGEATTRIPHDPILRRALALASCDEVGTSADAWQREGEVSGGVRGAFAHGTA